MYCDLWISKFKKEYFPRKLYEEIRYVLLIFFAKIYSLLTHVRKTPPLRSHYLVKTPHIWATNYSNMFVSQHFTCLFSVENVTHFRRFFKNWNLSILVVFRNFFYFVVGGAIVHNVLICNLTEEIISNSRNLLSRPEKSWISTTVLWLVQSYRDQVLQTSTLYSGTLIWLCVQ